MLFYWILIYPMEMAPDWRAWSAKIINVLMCKLRRKIVDAGASGVVIDTIWGQSYILREVRDYDTMTISALMRLIHQT